MDRSILDWLLEENTPEVRLRTLKEYEKLPEDDEKVVECKKALLDSKIYERGLKKLRMDKPWAKYDAIMGFAEWGLTREGYRVLDRHRLENGRYLLTASKSVQAFKAGNVGEETKWVTLYAYMAQ